MGRLIFSMNVSLDGYVDHDAFAPDPSLFRHFVAHVRGLGASLYGRRMYEIMRYWDDERPEWSADERDFAHAWRNQPKWVVSRTLTAVGPNATLATGDLAELAVRLKADVEGEIDVAGPVLAQGLTDLGLIDEYRLYIHPHVVGHGNRFFQKARPPLRLVSSERVGDGAVRLAYVPV